MAILRFYWPDCKGGCGRPILETCAPLDIITYCPECQGMNIFRDSTEPAEFLPLSDYRDAAQLSHCTNNEKERLSAVVQWAESFYRLSQPPDKGDCISHSEK